MREISNYDDVVMPLRDERTPMELTVLFGIMLGALWNTSPKRIYLEALAFVWIVFTTMTYQLFRQRQWEQLGLKLQNSLATLWLVYPAVAIVCVIFAIGLAQNIGPTAWAYYPFAQIVYVVGAFIQQFILGPYIITRLEKLHTPEEAIKLRMAFVFSAFHVPNWKLMLVGLVGGYIFAGLFLKYRNYYTIAVCHSLIGAALAVVLPKTWMMVGIGFWQNHFLP